MDADSGKIISQPFPMGDPVGANGYGSEMGLIASATREGTLHIIHEDSPDKYSVVEIVKTEFVAKKMALDPKTHNFCLTTSDFGPAPATTAQQPNPQPVATSGMLHLLIYGR